MCPAHRALVPAVVGMFVDITINHAIAISITWFTNRLGCEDLRICLNPSQRKA
jgi:hypothetical protein